MIPLYDGEKLYVRLEHPVLQEGHAHPNRMDGGPRMRLPNTAHTSRPWRIRELTRAFRLEDVWALPTPGGPDDFPRLVQGIAGGRERHSLCPSIPCTSRGKSSGPPGVGNAHTSSSRKARVSLGIRQGREVCAVFGSLIVALHQYSYVWMESYHHLRRCQLRY